MTSEFLSYNQAMKYLGVKSSTTLSYYIAAGLPIIQIGKSKRIARADIDQFMNDHKVIKGEQATNSEGGTRCKH